MLVGTVAVVAVQGLSLVAAYQGRVHVKGGHLVLLGQRGSSISLMANQGWLQLAVIANKLVGVASQGNCPGWQLLDTHYEIFERDYAQTFSKDGRFRCSTKRAG